MSDQIVLAFGWKAQIEKEILRIQMMRLAGGEHPMVREFVPLVISVTDQNEPEFMSKFRQFANFDDLSNKVVFNPHARHWWKHIGLIALRQILLLPLRILGFKTPLKTVFSPGPEAMRTTTDIRNAEEMRIQNDVVGFMVLGRRLNDRDSNGREMR